MTSQCSKVDYSFLKLDQLIIVYHHPGADRAEARAVLIA